jgi:hypothetical protein
MGRGGFWRGFGDEGIVLRGVGEEGRMRLRMRMGTRTVIGRPTWQRKHHPRQPDIKFRNGGGGDLDYGINHEH